MTPIYKIIANKKEITEMIRRHFISLRLYDTRGYQADTFQLVLNDTNASIERPKKGAKLEVYLGYQGQELNYKGEYVVDEFSHSGPPDKLTITAKAADMLQTLKTQKSRSWDRKTIDSIIQTIAIEHGLTPVIAEKYKTIRIDHIDQTDESDLHFIARLAKQYDAIAKPATGRLIFSEKGSAKTASGNDMPLFIINRREGYNHHYTEKGRQKYQGVRAYWQDKKKAERTGEYVGGKDGVKTVKGTFANKTEAQAAAQAEYKRLSRSTRELDIDLKLGRPEIIAESLIQPIGYRNYIDVEWICKEVTHSLSPTTGLQTQLKLEQPNAK